MRDIVFHIGTPKTGSSALQVYFAQSREALLAKSIDYLPIGELRMGCEGKISSGNGALLARALLKPTDPAYINNYEEAVAVLLESLQASSSDLAVISSELFTFADIKKFAALTSLLVNNGYNVKCFYYIRSPCQLMSSAYIQQVKRHQCTATADTWVTSSYKDYRFLHNFSFYNALTLVFGRDNILCRTYDKAIQAPAGLLRVFFDALGIEAENLPLEMGEINPGLTPSGIAIMRILNKLKPHMKFSDEVVMNNSISKTIGVGFVHQVLSPSVVAEIDAYFESENRAMAKHYFCRDRLFHDEESVVQERNSKECDIGSYDIVEFLGGLLIRYDERLRNMEKRLGALSSK